MLFFETNELGFTTEFLGRIRCARVLCMRVRDMQSAWAHQACVCAVRCACVTTRYSFDEAHLATHPPAHPPTPVAARRLVAAVASLIGVGVYNYALKETPLR